MVSKSAANIMAFSLEYSHISNERKMFAVAAAESLFG